MKLIRNRIATPAAVALCLAMVGCSSPVDEKSAEAQRQTDSDAAALAAEKEQQAPAGGQSEAAGDDDAEENNDGDTLHIGAAYVAADRLNVRLAPSLGAEVTSVLRGGQRVVVHEMQEGWSRITPYHDESTAGDAARVARWVASAYLSATRPDDDTVPVESASPLDRAIDNSDDSHAYRSSFLAAARRLIERGQCTVADFEEIGGWVRSAVRQAVYFTYCGGRYASNRIYLDVGSGRTFRLDSEPAAAQN